MIGNSPAFNIQLAEEALGIFGCWLWLCRALCKVGKEGPKELLSLTALVKNCDKRPVEPSRYLFAREQAWLTWFPGNGMTTTVINLSQAWPKMNCNSFPLNPDHFRNG